MSQRCKNTWNWQNLAAIYVFSLFFLSKMFSLKSKFDIPKHCCFHLKRRRAWYSFCVRPFCIYTPYEYIKRKDLFVRLYQTASETTGQNLKIIRLLKSYIVPDEHKLYLMILYIEDQLSRIFHIPLWLKEFPKNVKCSGKCLNVHLIVEPTLQFLGIE